MTTPVVAECVGLWRRSLLIGADGSRDATSGVQWLQGTSAYVDSRGFAGRLGQSGDVFEWHRDVDLEPPGPFPDAGRVHWDGEVLVETGVHTDYVEVWVRDAGPPGPAGAVFLRAPDGGDGLLLRVGESYGWAGGTTVVIGVVGDPRWASLAIEAADDDVAVDGKRWAILSREGNMN